ncbi:NUMOD4 motif-containing HNH endonuclease [Vibrio cholerae]
MTNTITTVEDCTDNITFLNEVWKEVYHLGKHTNYSVSNHGRVKNRIRDRIMKTPLKNSGYEQVGIMVDGKKYVITVHRLVANAFIPNPDNLETVDHIDGNKTNNHVSNLQWMTRADNLVKEHAKEHTLHYNGETMTVYNLKKWATDNGLEYDYARTFRVKAA